MREIQGANGAIHRLEISEPARLRFDRNDDGVISARVARAESVRDISRADRLIRRRQPITGWKTPGRSSPSVPMQVEASRPASED